MTRDIDRTEALRSELVRAIVEEAGVPESMAMPYANSVLAYLQRNYPGQKLYVPAAARHYDVLQIQAALERGTSISTVCRDHAVSRSMLYKLFPGGIPTRRVAAA